MSNYGGISIDLDRAQLKVKLRPKTLNVVGTCAVIDIYGKCNKVELIESMVIVGAEYNNMLVDLLSNMDATNGFALSITKKVVSANPCGVVKHAGKVGALMRSTVMAKPKYMTWIGKMSDTVEPIKGYGRIVVKSSGFNEAMMTWLRC